MKRIFGFFFLGCFLFGFSAEAAKGKNEELKPQLLIEPESYDFGSILVGDSATTELVLTNAGEADLRFSSISLDSPIFYRLDSNCTDKLKVKAVCRLRVEFFPLAAGLWENRLFVLSDDPVQPQIAIPLRGIGGQVIGTPENPPSGDPPSSKPPGEEIPAFSEIQVRDSVSPEDDLRLPFGSVPIGVDKRKTLQIINRSENLITVGTIVDLPPFAIENDTCSGAELASQDQCTLEVVFIPTVVGAIDADLVIDTSSPTNGRITVALSGLGTPASDYYPAPALIHPLDGQINLKDSVLLRWYNCRDAAGNLASYRISSHKSPAAAGAQPNLEGRSALPLGFGLGALFFLWPAAAESRKSRRWVFLFLAASLLTVACSEDIEDSSTATISGLEGKSTYSWQVIAEYADGIETPSEVRSFTTR